MCEGTEELSTPILLRRLRGGRPGGPRAGRERPEPGTRPSPRRLFLRAARRSDLAAVLFKSRHAFVTVPELADEGSPAPWGWTCAIQDRFRDQRCTVRDLLLAAAIDLETGLPPYMRQNPAVMAPVLAQATRVRALLEVAGAGDADDPDLLSPFHLVVHERSALRDRGVGDAAADERAEGDPVSSFGDGPARVWEVFGDPGDCPRGLPTRDLAGVAAFLRSGRCRSVVVMSGAGISTSSGIPSYRGGAGLWTSIRPEMLSATPTQRARIDREPEWVASAELFQENPVPFLEVKREFILGLARRRWLPTAAHHVVALLHRHGLLARVLTQNIDGLHQESGVPSELVTEIHGSTRSARCDGCGHRLALEEHAKLVKGHVRDLSGTDPLAPPLSSEGGIPCPQCSRASVRPDTVLFGEEVNPAFREVFRQDLPAADLLVVVGTTLLVAPAAKAPMEVSPECVRLVINDRRVGENVGLVFDEPDARRDIMVEDDIDATFVRLAGMMGWLPDLEALSGQMSVRGAERVAAAVAAEEGRFDH